ncbi:hypothetical protein [Pusillimonas noertemannii]|uniref:Uncharacterized protein n=1 Tax=Pusillimonas noertemannii TaxID=305977 RepID=A0A2U1CRZ6_9BURK|nr:hypothetical protein [Pusillimonas noertemannii]NYT67999.1 hypothetical protein [Pusillimonas noertemannii]PVY68677.1 hypothetical protein C7440_1088 [Pusillimonas noertemannii]TFL11862.1 hypothetical protein CSC72_01650 [Pusillimonas noertemannii]
MKVTVVRTHRLGQLLPEREWGPPVPGPVQMYWMRHPELNRGPGRLTVVRRGYFGKDEDSPIPELQDPEMLAFMSDRVLSVKGFEEIEGRRYYQTWRIYFED